jgi:hypothetical protein
MVSAKQQNPAQLTQFQEAVAASRRRKQPGIDFSMENPVLQRKREIVHLLRTIPKAHLSLEK